VSSSVSEADRCERARDLLHHPGVDKLLRISLRTVTLDIPPQDVITRDNVSIKVNAVVYFRVVDPNKAVVEVENYLYATSQLAQTTLRSVVGQVELDELLASAGENQYPASGYFGQAHRALGIKVSLVETKQVDLPEEMRRAIARQAEAERERRAKVIHGRRRVPGRRETGSSRGCDRQKTLPPFSSASCRRSPRSLRRRTRPRSSPCPSTFSGLFWKKSRILEYESPLPNAVGRGAFIVSTIRSRPRMRRLLTRTLLLPDLTVHLAPDPLKDLGPPFRSSGSCPGVFSNTHMMRFERSASRKSISTRVLSMWSTSPRSVRRRRAAQPPFHLHLHPQTAHSR